MQLPERFESVDHLEEAMTTPSAALVADLARVPGDIMLLGVGGKMGPTLARLAKRAVPKREVFGTRIGHYLDPDGMAIAVSERRH